MFTDKVEFNLEQEVYILISIDFEKAPLGNSIKVTLFFLPPPPYKNELGANLCLTFHSWSPYTLFEILLSFNSACTVVAFLSRLENKSATNPIANMKIGSMV